MSKDDIGVRAGSREPNQQAVSSVPASIPDARARGIFEGDYLPVSQREAEGAATDLINHFFKNEPRSGGGVQASIPARPDRDTDLLLMRFLREADRLERAFRIRVWNDARALGVSQDTAMQQIEREVRLAKQPPTQAIEARQGGDAGSIHESAVGETDAPNTSQEQDNAE